MTDKFESFKKFESVYFSQIEKTGKQYETFHPSITHLLHIGKLPTGTVERTVQDEVAIYMMEHEYERFMRDWSNYIDLIYMCETNEMIKAEFHKLLMLITLLK